jgi:hypothetical protein
VDYEATYETWLGEAAGGFMRKKSMAGLIAAGFGKLLSISTLGDMAFGKSFGNPRRGYPALSMKNRGFKRNRRFELKRSARRRALA